MLDEPHKGNIQPNAVDPFRKLVRLDALLSAEEERALAVAWRDNGDISARDKLVEAYAPLATSIAKRYTRQYAGGDQEKFKDISSEAYMGLLKAVAKFDPDRGVRFSTYAQWWIKAAAQEFIMGNISMTGLPNTSPARALFYKLKATEKELQASYPELTADEIDLAIAERFSTSAKVVGLVRATLKGDYSLNVTVGQDEGEGEGLEWVDRLEADPMSSNAELVVGARQEFQYRSQRLSLAMEILDDRERDVLTRRRLKEPQEKLGEIGEIYGLSKERIRQIEAKAFEKLRKHMKNLP